MKLSELIRKIRLDNQLSQLDLIDKISVHDKSLQDIPNVTISRWERNISIPPLAKVLTIIHIFELDAFEILTKLEYKQSITQLTAFDSLRSHLHQTNNFLNL